MKTIISIAILLIFHFFLNAQTVYVINSSMVKFSSDAPLEMIEASSTKMQGAIKTEDRSFIFRAPMSTFDGFNSSLQKNHFNTNYLETEKFPYTIFEGKIIEEIDFSTNGTYLVRGKGTFSCHGIKQERIIKCKFVISGSTITINADFTVLLDDHDIKIPSVVNQKIAEEIAVTLDMKLIKK